MPADVPGSFRSGLPSRVTVYDTMVPLLSRDGLQRSRRTPWPNAPAGPPGRVGAPMSVSRPNEPATRVVTTREPSAWGV